VSADWSPDSRQLLATDLSIGTCAPLWRVPGASSCQWISPPAWWPIRSLSAVRPHRRRGVGLAGFLFRL